MCLGVNKKTSKLEKYALKFNESVKWKYTDLKIDINSLKKLNNEVLIIFRANRDTNLFRGPLICGNILVISPKWYNSKDTNFK